MCPSARELAAIFDRAAPCYDRTGPRFFRDVASRLLDFVDVRPRARVLDLATGTGVALEEVAARVGRAVELTGIDLSPGMIEQARGRLDAAGLSDAELDVMDAEHLAFQDGRFDLVLCSAALHLFPAPDRALSECHRVLRPGGTFAAAVFGDEDWGWRIKLRRRYSATPESLASGLTATQLVSLVRSAGLVEQSLRSERLDVAFADADEWWACQWSHGERAPLERMSEGALLAYRRAAFEAVESYREADRRLHWRPEILLCQALRSR